MNDRRPTLELHPAGEPGLVAEANKQSGAQDGWHIPESKADETR